MKLTIIPKLGIDPMYGACPCCGGAFAALQSDIGEDSPFTFATHSRRLFYGCYACSIVCLTRDSRRNYTTYDDCSVCVEYHSDTTTTYAYVDGVDAPVWERFGNHMSCKNEIRQRLLKLRALS